MIWLFGAGVIFAGMLLAFAIGEMARPETKEERAAEDEAQMEYLRERRAQMRRVEDRLTAKIPGGEV